MTESREMTDDEVKLANTRTVDALQRVYAFLIALALTTAVRVLMETFGVSVVAGQVTRPQVELFTTSIMAVAFLLTVVVFYQGMNRHLDDAFVFAAIGRWHRGLLLIDIFTFVIEAGI